SPFFEVASAARARPICLVEDVLAFGSSQFKLFAGAVTGLLLRFFGWLGPCALLAGLPEQHFVAGRELLLKLDEQLHLLDAVPLRCAQLLLQLEDLANESLVLTLQQLRSLAQLFTFEVVDAEGHGLRCSPSGSAIKIGDLHCSEISVAGRLWTVARDSAACAWPLRFLQ